MRPTFTAQLENVGAELEEELGQAVLTLTGLDQVILHPTRARAEALEASGRRLRRSSRESDVRLVTLSATQAPVACDLRLVLTMMQIVQHQVLIANQFGLMAEQLIAIDPGLPDRCGTAERTSQLAGLARDQLEGAAAAFSRRDPAQADRLARSDDRLDQLNREICRASLEARVGPEQRELAFRHVLIARSLERIGDNAVNIARRTAELVRADVHHLAATGTA